MDAFLYIYSLSHKISVDPSMGTPNILSLYRNVAIRSIELFIAVKSDPNVNVFTPFFHLMCHVIGDSLQNICIPVMDILLVLSPSWLSSTKQWINIYLPLGFWHIQGYRFASIRLEIFPIKLLEYMLGYHWFP